MAFVFDLHRAGLKTARMLGRCQRFPWRPQGEGEGEGEEEGESEIVFYLDGAHTKDSLVSGARWAENEFLRTLSADPEIVHPGGPRRLSGAGGQGGVGRVGMRGGWQPARRLLVFYCSGALLYPRNPKPQTLNPRKPRNPKPQAPNPRP